MKIVWDEPKRQANLAKHGIDFADIGPEFFETAYIGRAKHGRMFALGRGGPVIVVIFAAMGSEAISIVSARRANRKEREAIE